ncbi:hypothetical protein UFOVP667_8 [uncultured Caudovirales phage]|uniref:Uncharacterized protein n=1 Tax=uncultured Caudovirales phage TaxID=2100421 RepID=A0A6J5NAD0_9CAUD|nr:hypothetical protein UFOVP667_8 [uncultured Caudovirales phage]
MKVIEVGNKTYIVRHWFRWYRVQRAGGFWQPLSPIIKNGRPLKTVDPIEHAANMLRREGKGGTAAPIDLTE